ncbi:Clan CA, family C1, cathepsin B-like cysteine peptidase [Tritrichomonas foetus]|uniref:Clan CA, family C1, cathepsin B-like cysteine peptidase n=1 Tax=Tritrichomonas foetus TaxID=1144522 RepID=A0A1J4L245_9EUKA|nr:Clan CA, family C1, cathepsin B-like cysteine peptidase [Tritrichomonas foetus]|eukprot:OHT17152.1 Clan CA, family C1, cathepsin B-like cysteine peptidase [Tritrichomonas foetus]
MYLFTFLYCIDSISPKMSNKEPRYNMEIKLPSNYSFFDEYPYCQYQPFNGSCDATYAQGVLLSVSHRFCRLTEEQLTMSLQYLVSCDPLNLGCRDGNTQSLIYFLEQEGITDTKCHPWENKFEFNTSFCAKCKDGSDPFHYRLNPLSYKIMKDITKIQEDIYLKGPVACKIVDLSGADEDIIRGYDEKMIATQTAEIIGWEEKEELVWIVYHEKWGIKRVRAGFNDALIESEVYSMIPEELVISMK